MMEALSPRSTNQMIKPKAVMDRKIVNKPAAAAGQKASSKNHADPPPPLVPEPAEGGERYAIGAFLGKGGFAVCYEGTLARNGRVYAMKVVKSQMPQKKMEEKVGMLFRMIGVKCADSMIVPDRVADSFENAPPICCSVLPGFCIRAKYICRIGVMSKWVSDGYGAQTTIPNIARSETVHDSTLRRHEISTQEICCAP